MTTFELVTTVCGSLIGILSLILGYFLKIVHNDVRENTSENGKLKGKIELLEQKQNSDLRLLQESTQSEIKATQTEIKNMATSVNKLSKNVNSLVLILAKKNMIDDIDLDEA